MVCSIGFVLDLYISISLVRLNQQLEQFSYIKSRSECNEPEVIVEVLFLKKLEIKRKQIPIYMHHTVYIFY